MCGLFGVIQNDPVVEVGAARRALASISHRGPDASGEWTDGHVYLGHRRLSIIDLSTGDQPMTSHDGRYTTIFNGEIYNFPSLREELGRTGARFNTHSDTEVILEGYRRWNTRVVERLEGMFAFLIWDRQERVAFVARDRLGIKPLCWAMQGGALLVASTLEPFLALDVFRSLDPVAVRDAMTFDYIAAPRTILTGVSKLDPGSAFSWSPGQGRPAIDRYWSPPQVQRNATPPDEHETEALLEAAVERQMISDVPVGAFLSGGVDSSLLVGLMSRHSRGPVKTFSVAFPGDPVDESNIARAVAERFGTDHTVIEAQQVGATGLVGLLGRLDEPLCDPAYVPTVALSASTARHVKVALSGDGADEVFGGYGRYRSGYAAGRSLSLRPLMDAGLRALPWKPACARPLYWRLLSSRDYFRFATTRYGDFPVFPKDLRQLLSDAGQREAKVGEFFSPWESRARRYGYTNGNGVTMDLLMRADLETYLSENCLVKTDRASMLASLEVRVPYLDETVLARILPLPAEQRIVHGDLKALLTPVARRLLPREVWDRPKHGFTVPLDRRLREDWRTALDAVFDWGEANLSIFDHAYIRRLRRESAAGRDLGRQIWNPFVLTAWCMERSLRM